MIDLNSYFSHKRDHTLLLRFKAIGYGDEVEISCNTISISSRVIILNRWD